MRAAGVIFVVTAIATGVLGCATKPVGQEFGPKDEIVRAEQAALPARVEFDGEGYQRASSVTQGNVELAEFVRPGETLSSWTQLVSIQVHASASRVSDVMNSYAAARKHLYAADPKFYQKADSAHAEDMIFEFLLAAPDRSHFEFVLLRAMSDPGRPVILYVFSRRIPRGLTDSEVDAQIAHVRAKRPDWFHALATLSYERSG